MHYPYQQQANALPGAVFDSGEAWQGHDPNMWPYQQQANVQIDRVVDSYDIPQNLQVVAPMARNWGWDAAGQAYNSERSSTLQVSGLNGLGIANIGPQSGSTARQVSLTPGINLVNGLGDVAQIAATSTVDCNAADPDTIKAAAAMALGFDGPITVKVLNQVATVFGDRIAVCLYTGMNAQPVAPSQASMATCKTVGVKAPGEMFGCGHLITKLGIDADELQTLAAAGARMHEKGWWEKDKWKAKWWLLSGATPWFKNPLYYAGGVGVLLTANWFRKRK